MNVKPVIPFEPISVHSIPQGTNWAAQVKWDGVRMLTYSDGTQIRLINRKLNDRTMQYPELVRISRYCSASSVILDGEIIAFESSRPSFQKVMKRDSLRKQQRIDFAVKQIPVAYMIFDVLFLDGDWVIDRSLGERQHILERIITPQPDIQVVQNFTDANQLYEVMKHHQMEGIVCKDLTSTYAISGKDQRWQKKKIYHDHLAVVGGVTLRHGLVNAVLLGLYNEKGQLIYIGHSGTGKLTNQDWCDLTEKIIPVANRPFYNEPERSKDAIWVKPELIAKVQFMEWTPGHTMRHPSIQAFVEAPLPACSFNQPE